MRGQYGEELQVCEHRCDERLSPIEPCEALQAAVRTSGADSQHDRNCVRKKEEVGVEGLGLSVYMRPEVVVSQTKLTNRCDQQTAPE